MELPRSGRYHGSVTRRYAILDDNQLFLEGRLAELRRALPGLLAERMRAAMVIGSVADGRARDESDIDLLLVLREGSPQRADYEWWNAAVVPGLCAGGRSKFPVEPTIIGTRSITTDEPNLRRALRTGVVLWDPEGVFGDQSESRT